MRASGPLVQKCRRKRSAFILFEVMLAVAVFVIGVVVLGECVQRCMQAEVDKREEVRIRRVLENRMLEIQAGAVPLQDSASEELKGMFAGMTLKTTREPFKGKNENGQELPNLFVVRLEVTWTRADGEKDSRDLQFYVNPRR